MPSYTNISKPNTPYTKIQGAENYLLINSTDFILINSTDKLVISNAKNGGFDSIYTSINKPS